MVRGGIWIKSKVCLSWLVGWLSSIPLRSRSIEKRELKGAYILLLLIKKKKPPGENVQPSVRYRPRRKVVGIYVHGRQNRTKSSKDTVWCHA